ncbi:hypothetical protein M413DRAFT_32840 [Hebeloma cylindrosporum]|uniref:Tubulin beta chain n=1 Tax=Hebeloma cylindrosporum TaxID=76867 RepID=A0A0C3BDZ8_HEBCY|nr:hypothetical protein M413DRAFT_32840 [Hebeloma cylindrosporum h7]
MSPTREILNVQVGQAGNHVGEAYWQMLLAEHGIDNSGAGVYIDEITGGSSGTTRYVPRSIQVDLEPDVCDQLRAGVLGNFFRPDTYLSGRSGARNNWAKGYHTDGGAELADSILEDVRRQAEGCDALQGFQILHSLGGGTGAGLGTLTLSNLLEEYPDRMMATFSIFPTPSPESLVEPYNVMLSVHQLIENCDLTICIDNEALYETCTKTLKIKHSNFEDLNSHKPALPRATKRRSTQTWNEFGAIPSCEIFTTSIVDFQPTESVLVTLFDAQHAPFYDPKAAKRLEKDSVSDLTKAVFDRKNLVVACDPRSGFVTFLNPSDYTLYLKPQPISHSRYNLPGWIPDNVSVSLVGVPPVGQSQSATALSNSTAIQEMFQKMLDRYLAMFKRKAFLHYYTDQGMDIMDFVEAEENIHDLLRRSVSTGEFFEYQQATADDEEERKNEERPSQEE